MPKEPLEALPEEPAKGKALPAPPARRSDVFPILTAILGLLFGGMGILFFKERGRVTEGIAKVSENADHLRHLTEETRYVVQNQKQFVLKADLDARWKEVDDLKKQADAQGEAGKVLDTRMGEFENAYVKVQDFSRLKDDMEKKHQEFRLRLEQVVADIERIRKKNKKFETFFYGTASITIPKGGREALQPVDLTYEGKPIPFASAPAVFIAPNAVVRSDPRNPGYRAATEQVVGVAQVGQAGEGWQFQARAFSEYESLPADLVIEFMWFAVGDVRETP